MSIDPKRIIATPKADFHRLTGRACRIKFEALDAESLRELQRFLRDLHHEQQMAVNRARMMPWRRP